MSKDVSNIPKIQKNTETIDILICDGKIIPSVEYPQRYKDHKIADFKRDKSILSGIWDIAIILLLFNTMYVYQ